ncbi:MAG TPA: beta-ketoacyl synthase N-terminal-like domain-containing protein [Kofleriaceae bacterium]|nr:beta-ketoacyl synthase N-terminal-like domain-containing protein [Kofleriaceae bacterium]
MVDEIWITGYGLVSPLGATTERCWERLEAGTSTGTRHPRCGYAYHPVVDFDPQAFVQRRADVRQMGDLMLYSTAAASKALHHAGLTAGAEALSRLQICICADGGERDVAADEAALAAVFAAAVAPAGNSDATLNEQLMRARPSHFLTQLPNLIPSNICIVNGFSAPSRTLMGTEATSVEALRDAARRIAAGQGELFLVGSSKNAADMGALVNYSSDGVLAHDPPDSVWSEAGTGYCLASAGAFVVVEAAAHARRRGATPLARVASVDTSVGARGASTDCERRLLARWQHATPRAPRNLGVLSGITGHGDLARRERNFLSGVQAAGVRISARATARIQGHSVEAAFFSNLVLAVMCLERRRLFAPLDAAEPLERVALDGPLTDVLVTAWGTTAAAGFAQLEAVA